MNRETLSIALGKCCPCQAEEKLLLENFPLFLLMLANKTHAGQVRCWFELFLFIKTTTIVIHNVKNV